MRTVKSRKHIPGLAFSVIVFSKQDIFINLNV